MLFCVHRWLHFELFTRKKFRSTNTQLPARVQLEVGVRLPRDARKRRTNNESDMECGDLSPLWPRRQNESGDKSPHSKRGVIVRLQLTKAAPEATPTFNCTRSCLTNGSHSGVRHARSTTTPRPSFLVSIRRSHLRLWNSRPRFDSDALRMSRQRAPASQRVPRFRESPKILGLNGAGHV